MSSKMSTKMLLSWCVFFLSCLSLDASGLIQVISLQLFAWGFGSYIIFNFVAGGLLYCEQSNNKFMQRFKKLYAINNYALYVLPVSYSVFISITLYQETKAMAIRYNRLMKESTDDFLWYIGYRILSFWRAIFKKESYELQKGTGISTNCL